MYGERVYQVLQQEYQIILELSGRFPVELLCCLMEIPQTSFYTWKQSLSHPANRTLQLVENISLFRSYHLKYPSQGYRWLNAKIRLDTGLVLSDLYAHKCCKAAGIKSKAKHYSYRKPGVSDWIFQYLLLSGINVYGPLQCIVSDMTGFYVKGVYYELTLYMNLWNTEVVSHAPSSRCVDRMTYISVLESLLALNERFPEHEMILHSD